MKPLGPPDSHHLSAALGWLGLGNCGEAVVELEKIAPELRNHPAVLPAWYEVCAERGQWNAADKFAEELVLIEPQEPQFWLWHAYATRRRSGGGIAQAREILDKAHELIPGEPFISYNLGCYECQLGNLQVAWKWLEKAFAAGNRRAFKALALEDRDLEPLWEKIKGA